VDVELAKRLASAAPPDATRRLWLLVAEHTVATTGRTDPKLALRVLDECPTAAPNATRARGGGATEGAAGERPTASGGSALPGEKVLSIEDVLPFFGDMATIDDFKAKVVEALEAYDAQIDGLKKEMDGLAESAREVHRELDALAARQLTVSPHTKCALSGQRVLEGPFYVFPSGFACAQQPLIRFVTPHLPPHKQRRVRDLCARLGYPPPPLAPASAPAPNARGGGAAASKAAAEREAAKEQERLEALREGPGATLSAAERDAFQLQLDDLVRTGGGVLLGGLL
jgi:hypothetical protein